MDAQALISGVALQKGAHLRLVCDDQDTGLDGILPGVSTAHLLNMSSPTLMEYRAYTRGIQLLGPHGSVSLVSTSDSNILFAEFPLLPVANIRELHLIHYVHHRWMQDPVANPVLYLSFFPALETLTITHGTKLSHLFSALWPNPSSPPSLKTRGFLGCIITEGFMEELTRFASERKKSTSAQLCRVVIVHWEEKFPSTDSIRGLGMYVPAVDVRVGVKLPTDISPNFP